MVSGSLALLFFLLSFHGGRQDSSPNRGQSPGEWGDFPSVRSSVLPFPPIWAIRLGLRLSHPDLRPNQPCLKPEAQLAGWLALRSGWLGLRPGWLGLRPGWLGLRPGWLGLPILQDFVSYWGCCPKSRAGQGNR